MEIRAKVALSLPSTFYKVTLKYDTFQKATYDSYLIASLVKNTKNKTEAMNYIDEITGKGSLNAHFKKLYDEISLLSKNQIDDIVRNSLFPITVVDQKNHFKYYSMFGATRMNNKVYDGNLKEHEEILIDLIMPKGDKVKFLSIEYQEEPATIKQDNYNAIFSDETIRVDLDNNQYYEISKEDFDKVHVNDVDNLGGFLGIVGNEITDGNWNVLSNSIVGTLNKVNYRYRDSNGIHTVLYNDCIKTIEIINVFGLYFYKENKYDFSLKNGSKCEDAINYLMESKNINEFKTKSLVYLLASINDKLSQKVIQYILDRKDSKEISECGMRLIKSGLEKGWEENVLKAIKKQIPMSDFKYLYRINSNLGFEVEDILDIDDIELTDLDKARKNEYLSEKDNMLRDINLWIGEITNSGIREKIKSLEKSSLKDSVKKFLDKRTGHNKKDYKNMSMAQLKREHDEIQAMYVGDYQKMVKFLEDIEKNTEI